MTPDQIDAAEKPAPRSRSLAGVLATLAILLVGGVLLVRVAGFGGAASTPEFMPVTTDLSSMSFEADTPVVAVITADWCGPCQQLKRTTLSDEGVRGFLVDHAQPVMIDGTDSNEAMPTLERLGIRVFPTTVVLRDGQPVARLEGFVGPEQYLAWLESQL